MDDDEAKPENRNALAMVERDELGRVKAGGPSLNPGGRPAALRDMVDSIRARSPELVARLFKIALEGKPGAPTTVRAAEILLERGFGKAPVMLEDAEGNRMRIGIVILPPERSDDDA